MHLNAWASNGSSIIVKAGFASVYHQQSRVNSTRVQLHHGNVEQACSVFRYLLIWFIYRWEKTICILSPAETHAVVLVAETADDYLVTEAAKITFVNQKTNNAVSFSLCFGVTAAEHFPHVVLCFHVLPDAKYRVWDSNLRHSVYKSNPLPLVKTSENLLFLSAFHF